METNQTTIAIDQDTNEVLLGGEPWKLAKVHVVNDFLRIVRVPFESGHHLSITFGGGSYTDNRDIFEDVPLESANVEVAIIDQQGAVLHDTVTGWVPASFLPHLVWSLAGSLRNGAPLEIAPLTDLGD